MNYVLAALLSGLLLTSSVAANEAEEDLRAEIIVPGDEDPITIREMEQRFSLCILYVTGQADPNRIIEVYELNTSRKRRDWEMQCQMTAMGIDVGYRTAQREQQERQEVENNRSYLTTGSSYGQRE